MNYQEVKELLNVGFSVDEIRQIMNNPQNPQDNPQDNQKPEQQEDKKHEEVKDPVPDPKENEKDSSEDKFNQLNSTVERLIKTIQASNLQNAVIESPGENLDQEVDKIMAGIIRPERKEED